MTTVPEAVRSAKRMIPRARQCAQRTKGCGTPQAAVHRNLPTNGKSTAALITDMLSSRTVSAPSWPTRVQKPGPQAGVRDWFRRRPLLGAILAGLLLRLALIPFLYADELDPSREHMAFGWEVGRVAHSIATGHGFGNLFYGETGPTAMTAPLYPYLMAGVFRLFGVYSAHSAIVLLVLQSIFAAITAAPVYWIARSTFGERVATWSAWLWAFFPYSIYLSTARVYENSLDALLLALLMWMALRLGSGAGLGAWAGFGAAAGVAVLCHPGLLSVAFPLGVWAWWRRRPRPWEPCAAVLALFVVLLPWQVRDYRTFHRLFPIRDNFWFECWLGNTGDLSDLYPDWGHPTANPAELDAYRKMGELAYFDSKRELFLTVLARHPGAFAYYTLKHVLLMWTEYWSFSRAYLQNVPTAIPHFFFCTAWSAGAFLGLRRAWKASRVTAMPYALVLFFFPLVYYVTHGGMDYRHPIDPVIVMLTANAVVGRGQQSAVWDASKGDRGFWMPSSIGRNSAHS